MADQNNFKRPSIYDEQLIAKVMNHLKYADPDHATREDAISLLAFMRTVAKEVAPQVNLNNFDEIHKAYKEYRNKQ